MVVLVVLVVLVFDVSLVAPVFVVVLGVCHALVFGVCLFDVLEVAHGAGDAHSWGCTLSLLAFSQHVHASQFVPPSYANLFAPPPCSPVAAVPVPSSAPEQQPPQPQPQPSSPPPPPQPAYGLAGIPPPPSPPFSFIIPFQLELVLGLMC